MTWSVKKIIDIYNMTKNKIITDTGLIAFNILDFHYRSKVAAFDYDHTLVNR